LHARLTLRAPGKGLSCKQGYFMADAMLRVKYPINSADGNFIAHLKVSRLWFSSWFCQPGYSQRD
jgi:hypothetical protein